MFDHISPTIFAAGFISPEGPSFDRNGVLHFVDWTAKTVTRVTPAGVAATFVNTGGTPTGSKFHRDGRLFVADGALGILAIDPDGTQRVVVSDYQGERFRGPNDLVFAPNGDLYFTDPKGTNRDNPVGWVYLSRADGTLERFAGGFGFPNGVGLSPDGRTLYLAETSYNRMWAFELDEHGRERSRRLFVQLAGGVGPDGTLFGQDGNLYVAHFGKGVVNVIDPAGQVIAELPAGGAKPTNVAFRETSLYVTEVEKGRVMRLDVGVRGQLLFGQA